MQIWRKGFERQRYEDMVSVLVNRLHPDAQRIDGKGGGGGRDIQIVRGQDNQITDAFDLKSFAALDTSTSKLPETQPCVAFANLYDIEV